MSQFQISVSPDYVLRAGEDGDYEVEVFQVQAVNDRGEVFFHNHRFESHEWEAADRLAQRIARFADQNVFDPSARPEWYFHRNQYGSDAYAENYVNEANYDQRLDVEGEFGPGSYRPGHPGYLDQIALAVAQSALEA